MASPTMQPCAPSRRKATWTRNARMTTAKPISSSSDIYLSPQLAASLNSNPNKYLGRWNAPKDLKEAVEKLAQLRRDFVKKLQETRKKERQGTSKKEAMFEANEECKLKAVAAKVRAKERKVTNEQFR
uniref:Uncharacterized protein n=1 Tax=Kalanchoe fedtschenkoi TaxID=63787 RepID=A0A7N1A1K4_KALFE